MILYLNELWRIVYIFFFDFELVDHTNVLQLPFGHFYLFFSLIISKLGFLEYLVLNSLWLKLEPFCLDLSIEFFLGHIVRFRNWEGELPREKRRTESAK